MAKKKPPRGNSDLQQQSTIVLYRTEDGGQRIEVRLESETVWLTQAGLAELFQTTKQNISSHLQHIYEEGELEQEATIKDYLIVRTDGNREVNRRVAHYNLEAVIAVGASAGSPRPCANGAVFPSLPLACIAGREALAPRSINTRSAHGSFPLKARARAEERRRPLEAPYERRQPGTRHQEHGTPA